MLPGLSPLELGRLRISVGYGTHKKGRPLSPTEVGKLLRRARERGASLEDCAKALGFKGITQVSRFLGILDLPPDLLHLVSWGRSSDSIGFTTAVELARVPAHDDQRVIAGAILEQGLQTDEVRQVAQLLKRSGRPVAECLREVIGMRPIVERVYVFMGAIIDEAVTSALADQTQEQRNAILRSGIEALGIKASGRLGEKVFTLVGDDRLNARLGSEGREAIEVRLRTYIKDNVHGVAHER
jgi:hypothetical protein